MIKFSKAKNLKRLKLKKASIPKLKIYKSKYFFNNKKKIIKNINNFFKAKVAIRSSSHEEDQIKKSNAGKFKSYLNINPKDHLLLEKKIFQVIKSYKTKVKNSEFFVQNMVKDIKISGVVLTRNLENFIPCFNINYFSGADSTNVTSGKKGSRNLIYFDNRKYKINQKFQKLILVVKEIQKVSKTEDLDIEFIIDKNKKIHILQVRNLIVPKKFAKLKYNKNLIYEKLEKKISKLKKKHYALYGDTTYFGVMSDWNPAEIIGIKPKPLALTLYRELVTDHVWAENRKIYGYRDLSQFHLMTSFYGTPFIDIRIDFNSWLPEALPKKLSNKIINFYLKTFKEKKYFHDKIEFEIVFTCYSLNTKTKINKRFKNLLNKNEKSIFTKQLIEINKIAIGQIDKDFSLIKNLIINQNLVKKSSIYYIDKIYWLIEDCKKFGTLPFAGLARCAFIATEILNSFVEENIFSEEDKLNFLGSLNTITSEMRYEMVKGKAEFLRKYGHLRPGTYEITSPNYRDNFKNYFHNYNKLKKLKRKKVPEFVFNSKQKSKINKFIKEAKIYKNFDELILFIKKSIKYREYSKFIFSKSVDMIFENLEKFGSKFSIKKDDLSYIKINEILELYFNLTDSKSIDNIKKHIQENKKEYLNDKNISLPDIIITDRDLYIQNKNISKINYISNKVIIDKIIEFKKHNLDKNLNGIVCIDNADPGFDFLFSKNITGLVTKYGGQNSHMAIRCAELNLPALIGVGDQIYKKIISCKSLKIDSTLKKIELIN